MAPAVAPSSPAAASPPAATVPNSTNGPPTPAPPPNSSEAAGDTCKSPNTREIVVCGERRQPYRLDPSIMEANRHSESNSRTASSATPVAQAVCSASPMGCGKGLDSLDLANVALVVGMMTVRAAEGKDWTGAFKTGGPDEYQLYRQAKQEREEADAERAARNVKRKAEEAERAHAQTAN